MIEDVPIVVVPPVIVIGVDVIVSFVILFVDFVNPIVEEVEVNVVIVKEVDSVVVILLELVKVNVVNEIVPLSIGTVFPDKLAVVTVS